LLLRRLAIFVFIGAPGRNSVDAAEPTIEIDIGAAL
jgi:hypothetical protein